MGRKLKWVCLGHLSGENNNPQLAAETHREIWGDRVPLMVASRYGATDVIEVKTVAGQEQSNRAPYGESLR